MLLRWRPYFHGFSTLLFKLQYKYCIKIEFYYFVLNAYCLKSSTSFIYDHFRAEHRHEGALFRDKLDSAAMNCQNDTDKSATLVN